MQGGRGAWACAAVGNSDECGSSGLLGCADLG